MVNMINGGKKMKMVQMISVISLSMFLFTCNSASSMGLSPGVIEIELAPGEQVTQQVRIENMRQSEIKVKESMYSWKIDTADRIIHTKDSTAWARIDGKEVILTAGEVIYRDLVVKAPKDLNGEIKVYMYFDEFMPQSMVATQIAVPVYLMNRLNKKTVVDMVSFSMTYSSETREAETQVVFTNKGNVHLRPGVSLMLKNKQSGEYAKDKDGNTSFIIARDWPVFPEANRTFKFTVVNLDLQPGIYVAELEIKFFYVHQLIDTKKQIYEVKVG